MSEEQEQNHGKARWDGGSRRCLPRGDQMKRRGEAGEAGGVSHMWAIQPVHACFKYVSNASVRVPVGSAPVMEAAEHRKLVVRDRWPI